MNCQAEQELSILSERLRAIGARVLSLDEDPGELTPLELVARLDKKLAEPVPTLDHLKSLYGMCLQDRQRQTGVLLRLAEVLGNDDLPGLNDIFEVSRLMREEVERINADAPAGNYTALRWICDGSQPDDETTVLVEQDDQEVGEGFVLDGAWYWQSGGSIDGKVTAWAHIPEGPGLTKRYQALAKKILGQWDADGTQPVPTSGKEGN